VTDEPPSVPRILHADGRIEYVMPANGKMFTLPELQAIVGGYIEMARTNGELVMILNEEGKLKGLKTNLFATALYRYRSADYIVGDVLLVELGFLEGDDDDG
jgi:hypothetical protein